MNVIIITSDEMRADCPSFMGNPDCRTPHLDGFARRAVVFDNHFTCHGKCVPSRIAMMTGRYSHTDGFRTINESNHLPAEAPDLLSTLKQHNYESAVFGHNHVWEDFWGSNQKSSGISDYHSYTEGIYRPMLDRVWPVQQPGPQSLPSPELPDGFDYDGRITEPLTGFCDDNRAEQAIDYLTNRRDRSRPFYLHLNIGKPHPSYKIEEPYFSMYDRERIRAFPHQIARNAPLPIRQMREIRTGSDAPESHLREVQAVYYGMITKVDELIGRVLEAIDREKLWDDSIVLFCTDHGDFAGQYGLVEKWDTAMQDCILRTPHILHAPGLPAGRRIASFSEHVDIAPTVLDLLGIAPPPHWAMHGRSLRPIIAGEASKTAVFADGGHEEAMLSRFNGAVVRKSADGRERRAGGGKQQTYADCPQTMSRTKMVRTDRWKLVVRLEGGNELYDVKADPWELDNLYGRADLAPVVMELQLQLINWCLRTDTDRPYQQHVGA